MMLLLLMAGGLLLRMMSANNATGCASPTRSSTVVAQIEGVVVSTPTPTPFPRRRRICILALITTGVVKRIPRKEQLVDNVPLLPFLVLLF